MATAQQVCEHYDLPPELFALFLDRDYLAYSAGRWQPGDDLEQAQRRNLHAVIRSLGITSESAVLDVGCGWGPLARVCIGDLAVRRYVGLTPSSVQIDSIRGRLTGNMELYPVSWQAFAAERGAFDAVIALESVEHIASPETRRSGEAIAQYRRFFDFCARNSTSSAGLYVQTSVVCRLPRTRRELTDVRFILDDVFHGSALADPELLRMASRDQYALAEMEWGAEDYMKTLQAWRQRLHRARDDLAGRFGAETYAHYDRYLLTCIRLFDSGVINLLRARFARHRSH